MRLTKQIHSPADYDKIEVTLIPGYPSLFQLTYPALSTALTKDFKHIEAQLEVDIVDTNDCNPGFISNLQERIIVQETHLSKSENAMKSKFHSLPIDPTTSKHYLCHNGNWQGATHDDTHVGEAFLRKYKILIPIMPQEIMEGGGVDEGVAVAPGSCGNCFYISWIIPVSGQDSNKLAEKPNKKKAIKLKSKEEKALEMLTKLNIG
jgi:hypothetical protein